MNTKIEELMQKPVMTATPSQTIEHVRGVMKRNQVHSLPVVNPEGEAIGIISTTDLLEDASDGSPISRIMSDKVYTIPRYESTHIAARMMRNHKIHHLVVTHEQRVVGIVSSFDLLRLVEDHRFSMKNPPTTTKRRTGERGSTEVPE